MARTWKIKVTTGGQVYTHYYHDDGGWEMDPTMPVISAVELSTFVDRIRLAIAQFVRVGWDKGEVEKEA